MEKQMSRFSKYFLYLYNVFNLSLFFRVSSDVFLFPVSSAVFLFRVSNVVFLSPSQ